MITFLVRVHRKKRRVEEEVEDEAAGSAGANDLTAVYTHTLTNLTGTFFFILKGMDFFF